MSILDAAELWDLLDPNLSVPEVVPPSNQELETQTDEEDKEEDLDELNWTNNFLTCY